MYNNAMDYLWSPWRMKYIMDKEKSSECVFCDALLRQDDENFLILHRGIKAFIMLNRYPYTSGHLMVLPYIHVPTYEDLDVETRSEIMELINLATSLLRKTYHPDAFNMGANIGEDAGAGIAPHLHFHLVPRWRGDSNFMAVTSYTRVLPEDLKESFQRLKQTWSQLFS
jgi:ATP adenylyltransferase